MRNAFIRGLTALAERDRRVVLLTGDLGFKIFRRLRGAVSGTLLQRGCGGSQHDRASPAGWLWAD